MLQKLNFYGHYISPNTKFAVIQSSVTKKSPRCRDDEASSIFLHGNTLSFILFRKLVKIGSGVLVSLSWNISARIGAILDSKRTLESYSPVLLRVKELLFSIHPLKRYSIRRICIFAIMHIDRKEYYIYLRGCTWKFLYQLNFDLCFGYILAASFF